MPVIVTHTDLAVFEMAFANGIVTVTVAPGVMQGSGHASVGGLPVCVAGDEANVMVPGCPYFTSTHSIVGAGILSIESLASDQQAAKVKSGGKAVLLAAGQYNAKFQVVVPAQQPAAPNPIPDTTPSYTGKGSFQSTNQRVKAT